MWQDSSDAQRCSTVWPAPKKVTRSRRLSAGKGTSAKPLSSESARVAVAGFLKFDQSPGGLMTRNLAGNLRMPNT
jgi:hypothetical protein